MFFCIESLARDPVDEILQEAELVNMLSVEVAVYCWQEILETSFNVVHLQDFEMQLLMSHGDAT